MCAGHLALRGGCTYISDVVQDVLIRSKLVNGFFRPGEECSDSVQIEHERKRIALGDLELSGAIPDSKYLDSPSQV